MLNSGFARRSVTRQSRLPRVPTSLWRNSPLLAVNSLLPASVSGHELSRAHREGIESLRCWTTMISQKQLFNDLLA